MNFAAKGHTMKIMLTGATGMVGKGVLLECLDDPRVTEVLALGRRSAGMSHPKLKELLHGDLLDVAPIAERMTGYDGCFFCLGTTSLGKSKEEYRRITRDLTLHIAGILLPRNPAMTFCYVSGAGTAGDGHSKLDWANVKGGVENDLLRMGFKAAYMFRPGMIAPKRGVRSGTAWINGLLIVLGPVLSALQPVFPDTITTTVAIGRAMLNVTANGCAKAVLENKDIAVLGR
jgi:uncharacterized protein YbjT (DUF2867 family)